MQGITGNFGDFLFQLDDLTDSIQKGSYRGVFKDEEGSDEEFEVSNFRPPILDDSEQEGSDIELDDEEEEEGEESQEMSDGDESLEEDEEAEDEDEDGHSDEDLEGDDSEDENDEFERKDGPTPAFIYRPTPGEDIYGRPIAASGASDSGGKYIPPARRQQIPQPTTKSSSVVDEVVRSLSSPYLSSVVFGIISSLEETAKRSTQSVSHSSCSLVTFSSADSLSKLEILCSKLLEVSPHSSICHLPF